MENLKSVIPRLRKILDENCMAVFRPKDHPEFCLELLRSMFPDCEVDFDCDVDITIMCLDECDH